MTTINGVFVVAKIQSTFTRCVLRMMNATTKPLTTTAATRRTTSAVTHRRPLEADGGRPGDCGASDTSGV